MPFPLIVLEARRKLTLRQFADLIENFTEIFHESLSPAGMQSADVNCGTLGVTIGEILNLYQSAVEGRVDSFGLLTLVLFPSLISGPIGELVL
jgi:hypothetical protein